MGIFILSIMHFILLLLLLVNLSWIWLIVFVLDPLWMSGKDIPEIRLLLLLVLRLLCILFAWFRSFVTILAWIVWNSILLQIFLVWIRLGWLSERQLLPWHVLSLVMWLWDAWRSTPISRVSGRCSATELVSRGCCISLSMILVARTLIEALI